MSQFKKHILVLEDESITAYNIEEALHKIGYKYVDVALNVEDARALTKDSKYDLLMLDVNLGGRYDGIEFAAKVREKQDDIPVMFLTGNSDPLTVAQASSIGPRAFLIKPFSEHEIKINLDLIFNVAASQSGNAKIKNELKFSKTFLENHPNLVIRVNPQGLILFTNSFISRIEGKDPGNYINKYLLESELDSSFVALVHECLTNAEKKRRKFSMEVTINTYLGERMMFVAVIPEMDEEKNLLSVIMLMQDMTDQKIATEDLILRNKKIVDSINYSKKIQQALLPTTQKLQMYLPDAGILLKPKDLVSGDFPWVARKGKHLFIAAVDCTGHGVPGALLSIIIHFLLNEIIRTKDELLPGRVLELLHTYTRRTLKQHMPGIESSDGADIALCRVDLETNEICYSGAHRPMFYTKGGEVLEVKGDRQPIGGEQYSKKKRRLIFANNFIAADVDTKVLIFSDGLSDQFGGTTSPKRKFGSLQISDILKTNFHKASDDVLKIVEKNFDVWKADQKQLDDVLAICFKLSN